LGEYKRAAELLQDLLQRTDKQARDRAEARLLHLKQQIEIARAQGKEELDRVRNVELAEAVRRLQAIGLENEEYIAFLAHELKNPLSTIRTVAGMLATDAEVTTRERMEYSREVFAIATRMFDMITRILSGSRTRLQKTFSSVDARMPYDHVLSHLKIAALEKGVTLTGDVSEYPIVVEADDQTLLTIFENLISNAVKFTSPGGEVRASLHSTLAQEGTELLMFSVKDSGPGLSDEDQLQLFQPFATLTPRPTANEVTSGLGLHLVRRSAEQLQGRVWCESTIGQGATFFVEIPLSRGTSERV
jgi:signal transduction histidine kinase